MYRYLSVAATAASLASASRYDVDSDSQYQSSYYKKNYVTFPKGYDIIDPNYFSTVLSRYQTCLSTKCDVLPSAYSAGNVNDCISTVAGYTSCVTACAAAETFQTVEDFRDLLGDVLAIGADQLRAVRLYLSGESDFDVLGLRVHIDQSCCLPKDYFAAWSSITVPVKTKLVPYVEPPKTDDDDDYYYPQPEPRSEPRSKYDNDYDYKVLMEEADAPTTPVVRADYMISAPAYLAHCADVGNKLVNKKEPAWIAGIECDPAITSYLQFLQANVGDLILTPDCEDRAPNGACCNDVQSNPRAVEFPTDVCIATEAHKGSRVDNLDIPLIKPVDFSSRKSDSCPSDKVPGNPLAVNDDPDTIIYYKRVNQRDLKYYSVKTGLPSKTTVSPLSTTTCEYNTGLVNARTTQGFFAYPDKVVGTDEIKAAKVCPTDGLLEYCNVKQYASYLQTQIFDHSRCDISELRLQHTDYPSSYQTVACLYKIFTLKCDCMEAVLNCYSHAATYESALSKTIGQAASILCGFILCQQPNVYSLFGEQYAWDHAILVRELLTTAGLMSMNVTPALTALVSFGLGMIALVAVKHATNKNKQVKIEHGYDNLI